MKTLIATSLTALLVAGAVAANAASSGAPIMPGATTMGTVSTPYAQSGRGSNALPIFQYQGAVPVTSSVGHVRTISILPWNVDLAHQTGGSR